LSLIAAREKLNFYDYENIFNDKCYRSVWLYFVISLRIRYGLPCRYFSRQVLFVRGSLKLFGREQPVSQNADQAALLIRDEIQGIFVCKSTRLWISISLQSAFRCFKRYRNCSLPFNIPRDMTFFFRFTSRETNLWLKGPFANAGDLIKLVGRRINCFKKRHKPISFADEKNGMDCRKIDLSHKTKFQFYPALSSSNAI
jgi:hypothetical protein